MERRCPCQGSARPLPRAGGRATMGEPGQCGMAMEYRECPSGSIVFGILFVRPLGLVSAILIRGADPSWWRAHRSREAQAMRLLQVTVRRWIVAAVIMALALAIARIGDRRLYFWRRAAYHAEAAKRGWMMMIPEGMLGAVMPLSRQQIAYHAAMARKYEHAARYPWLPVAPDPP